MKSLHFIILVLLSTNVIAQKYEPDRIRFHNKEYDYRFHHLEQYFNYYPEKRIVPNKDSTIINRNYIAYYEIYNDEIFLRDIKIKSAENGEFISVRNKFSPSTEERIPLRWINGVVQIGLGSDDFKKDSIHPMNTSNKVFEINRGKIKREVNFGKDEMRIFKNFQLDKFRNTIEFDKISYKLRNNGYSENEIFLHISDNILYYSRKIYLQK